MRVPRAAGGGGVGQHAAGAPHVRRDARPAHGGARAEPHTAQAQHAQGR